MMQKRESSPPRVLLLGRSLEVLQKVKMQVEKSGIKVVTSNDVGRAAELFHARDFDLIAFGSAAVGPVSEQVEEAFGKQDPKA